MKYFCRRLLYVLKESYTLVKTSEIKEALVKLNFRRLIYKSGGWKSPHLAIFFREVGGPTYTMDLKIVLFYNWNCIDIGKTIIILKLFILNIPWNYYILWRPYNVHELWRLLLFCWDEISFILTLVNFSMVWNSWDKGTHRKIEPSQNLFASNIVS